MTRPEILLKTISTTAPALFYLPPSMAVAVFTLRAHFVRPILFQTKLSNIPTKVESPIFFEHG
jgi:hypothetical protein